MAIYLSKAIYFSTPCRLAVYLSRPVYLSNGHLIEEIRYVISAFHTSKADYVISAFHVLRRRLRNKCISLMLSSQNEKRSRSRASFLDIFQKLMRSRASFFQLRNSAFHILASRRVTHFSVALFGRFSKIDAWMDGWMDGPTGHRQERERFELTYLDGRTRR